MKFVGHRLALATMAILLGTVTAVAQEEAAPAAAAEGGSEGGDEGLYRDPDAEAAYKRSLELIEQEKFAEALTEINAALKIDPTYDVAYIAKGDALQGIKEFAAAAQSYTKAIELDANSAAAYNGRGEAYLELQPPQVDLAVNDFRNALDMDRDDPKILSNLGHVSVNYLQDPVGGIRLLDEALARDDQDARAYRDRGLANALLKEFDKAEADLKKSAEIDSEDYENFTMLSQVYLLQEKYKEATDVLGKAIDAYQPEKLSDPKIYISAYLTRADAWTEIGNKETDKAKRKDAFEHVVADADKVLSVYKDRFPESGVALYRRGVALRQLGEYAKSIDSLTRAIQAVPAGQDANYLAEAYLRRGIDWFYQGNIDLARGDFEQAASTGEGYRDPRVYLWIGYTYFKSDDLRTAIDYYGEAIAKDPEFALAHVNRGLAYMKLEEFKKALASFNNAIRSEPSVGEHYYRAGLAYMKMEKYQEAADMFSVASLKDPKIAKFKSAAGEALKKLGKDNLGERWKREAEELPTE